MNNIKIIKSDNPSWNKYLFRFPAHYHDINFTSQYHRMMELKGDGEAELFVVEDSEKLFFHPYMINEIKNIGSINLKSKISDIQSVFGYTGPIVNTDDEVFIHNSSALFEEFCKNRGVVAEFIRFNPLLKNQFLLNNSKSLKIIDLKPYVTIDLSPPYTAISQNYSRNLRRIIRKVKTISGWHWVISKENSVTNDIINLLEKRLQEKKARSFKFYNSDYSDHLYNLILKNGCGFAAIDDHTNKIIVGAIFVYLNDSVYFLHSARDIEDSRSSLINSYIVDQGIQYFKQEGFSSFFFGGGVSNSSDDSLLKYKESFSEHIDDFYIGKGIFDKEEYTNLCEIWESQFPNLKDEGKNLVLKYRMTD